MFDSSEATGRTGQLQRSFKVGTIAGALLVAISYLLPWVDIVGPTVSADQSSVALEDVAGNTAGGSVGATEMVMFPELIAVFAIVAAGLSILRWNRPIQAMTGLFGLLGTGSAVFVWSFLTTEDDGLIEVGSHIGLPGSFDPAVGVWLALAGSACIAVCGFGGFAHATIAGEP